MRPMKKPKEIAKYVLGVRVDAELKEQIEAAAAADERSISSWISLAIKAFLKGKRRG
jgi:predicted HicB family RNase H-like nuclease